MAATFAIYVKVLIKWFYTLKDLSYFLKCNKFFRTGQKDVTKILKNACIVKLQV